MQNAMELSGETNRTPRCPGIAGAKKESIVGRRQDCIGVVWIDLHDGGSPTKRTNGMPPPKERQAKH
ncbi:MAG TPA: hypothetical protein VKG25_28865 [Bryobacteraceae bacterium]|nr:hypothetical protein [Bryobacteraceae bacterium]